VMIKTRTRTRRKRELSQSGERVSVRTELTLDALLALREVLGAGTTTADEAADVVGEVSSKLLVSWRCRLEIFFTVIEMKRIELNF